MKTVFWWLAVVYAILLVPCAAMAEAQGIINYVKKKDALSFEYMPSYGVQKSFRHKIKVSTRQEADFVLVNYAFGSMHLRVEKGIGNNRDILFIKTSGLGNKSNSGLAGLMTEMSGALNEKLAPLLKKEPASVSKEETITLGATSFLAEWPPGAPLFIAAEKEIITIGDKTAPRKRLDEIRKESIKRTKEISKKKNQRLKGIVSLCNFIGGPAEACYPKNWRLEMECIKVDKVGADKCTGRCGTGCWGLCPGKRYTQDCLNHDVCGDKEGLLSFGCLVFFVYCFSDCVDAPDCGS